MNSKNPNGPTTLKTLQAFFAEILKDELAGTGIEFDTRASLEGAELRLKYRQYGVVMISERSMEDPSVLFERVKWEAIGLARMMKRSLIAAGEGKNEL